MNTPGPVNTISNNYQRGMSDVAPTLQQTFDFVATHLLRQMKRAVRVSRDGNVLCVYRTAEGLSCAVGCLIPDDMYTPAMEEIGGVCRLLTDIPDAIPLYFKDQRDFLMELQTIHDQVEIDEWRSELRLLAEYHDLNTAVLS